MWLNSPMDIQEQGSEAITTRERLLETAARLFAERGKDGVSIRDIAAEAGVRHGGINYHFRSKDELYNEALMRFGPAAVQTVLTQELPTGLSPEAAKSVFTKMIRELVKVEVQQLDPIAAGLFRAEISNPEGPNDFLVENLIRPHHSGLANLIGQMFPEIVSERERAIAAFNVMSQCVFLRVARPVALKLFGVEDFDSDLTELFANRIIETVMNGLGSVVEKPA
ncbi:MAG: AcrR family transcriptional regulator [Hyphomicrobiaceae bacterium]|jgi:AcrR family transcriptional regulator